MGWVGGGAINDEMGKMGLEEDVQSCDVRRRRGSRPPAVPLFLPRKLSSVKGRRGGSVAAREWAARVRARERRGGWAVGGKRVATKPERGAREPLRQALARAGKPPVPAQAPRRQFQRPPA
eukprot:scaffold5064_cov115-Isochrysis_galbana.AAC.15